MSSKRNNSESSHSSSHRTVIAPGAMTRGVCGVNARYERGFIYGLISVQSNQSPRVISVQRYPLPVFLVVYHPWMECDVIEVSIIPE